MTAPSSGELPPDLQTAHQSATFCLNWVREIWELLQAPTEEVINPYPSVVAACLEGYQIERERHLQNVQSVAPTFDRIRRRLAAIGSAAPPLRCDEVLATNAHLLACRAAEHTFFEIWHLLDGVRLFESAIVAYWEDAATSTVHEPPAHRLDVGLVSADLNRYEPRLRRTFVGRESPDWKQLEGEIELEYSAAQEDQPPPSQVVNADDSTIRPKWDRPSRLLTIDSDEVEIASREAKTQFAILDLLQGAGWPDKGVPIPNDFGGDVKSGLDALNGKLSGTRLKLLPQNNYQRIGWKIAPL
jgi:hypothetical protein